LPTTDTPNLFIFQRPCAQFVIDGFRKVCPLIDLDEVWTDPAYKGTSAVVEAVQRLIEPTALLAKTAAVVGGRGYFGSQIVNSCRGLGLATEIIELGDSLEAVRNADIVVSAVGTSHLLDERHIVAEHLLVVDVGFAVTDGTVPQYEGDVNHSAYRIPRLITPVPGGVGPLQVATLIERAAMVCAPKNAIRWKLSQYQ
jgi:methylenetetrahydrofolate dehydrogenase (NADP+)/methenyltetrahydrofolate cyclohydrolase